MSGGGGSGEAVPGRGKPWGEPLAKLDVAWVAIEQRLCVWVVVAEIVVLCLWVALSGLSSFYEPGGGNVAGLVFRSFLTSVALGVGAHLATRSSPKTIHRLAVCGAFVAGLFLGKLWPNGGHDYASNLRAWIQNASAVMLIGGMRGLVTRLTLWLALLGASIATSRGKHINIDVATRYIPKRGVIPVAILGWSAAAIMCLAATWGFIDGIAVTKFRAEAFRACEGKLCDTPVGERLGTTARGVRSDLFLLGRQMSLDLKTLPKVLAGTPYDKWLKGREWNAWMADADWTAHFPKESVDTLTVSEGQLDDTRMPAVTAPGASNAAGLLIRDLNFILPLGLFIIALKFIIRILLTLSGHVTVDMETHVDDEAVEHMAHDTPEDFAVAGLPVPDAVPPKGGAS